MAEETQYTGNTGILSISTANPFLDGSGIMGSLITGSSNGTLIKKIYIKAQSSTTEGMIRFFVDNTVKIRLIKEIRVPAITQASVRPTFEIEIPLNFTLQSGDILKVSTEKAETFNVIAEGLDWAYYGPSVRTDTTQYTTNWGFGRLSVANPNLNGTGTIVDIFTGDATYKGVSIDVISIIGTNNVTAGMVRLYLTSGATKYLFKEYFINTQTGSNVDDYFEENILFDDHLDLTAGMIISASTQNADPFDVSVSGNFWKYLA